MKATLVVLCLAVLPLSTPTRMVTDHASVLSTDETAQLEAKLQHLRDSGLAEAIIYLAPSLPEGAVMEELTLQAVNTWGIGNASTNNGLAIFAFMKDRKVRIEVGLGLETRISNDAAAGIIANQIAPAFRAGKYAEGLAAALDQIEKLLRSPRRIVGPANAPRVLRRVNPHYPNAARKAGIQGSVSLEVLIDASGKVKEAKVVDPLPYGLDKAALEAVRQWEFEPVVVDGTPVPAWIDVVIAFRL